MTLKTRWVFQSINKLIHRIKYLNCILLLYVLIQVFLPVNIIIKRLFYRMHFSIIFPVLYSYSITFLYYSILRTYYPYIKKYIRSIIKNVLKTGTIYSFCQTQAELRGSTIFKLIPDVFDFRTALHINILLLSHGLVIFTFLLHYYLVTHVI